MAKSFQCLRVSKALLTETVKDIVCWQCPEPLVGTVAVRRSLTGEIVAQSERLLIKGAAVLEDLDDWDEQLVGQALREDV